MDKAKSFSWVVVVILQVWSWEGNPGKELRVGQLPKQTSTIVSEAKMELEKHRLDPLPLWSLQTAGDKLPTRAQALCAHNRRYLQSLAPGQGFQGQAGSMCFQRAAESLSSHIQMRGLAGPGCRAMGSLPSACVCASPGSGGKKWTACRSVPGGTGRLTFPRLTCMRTIFKNRFSKSKFLPIFRGLNPQPAHSTFC